MQEIIVTDPNLLSMVESIKDDCWDAQDADGYTACSDILWMLKHPKEKTRFLNGNDITAFVTALYRWLNEDDDS